MQLLGALRRLWRHGAFRRLLAIRLFIQSADGALQVGMASYILLSPQNQPDAWSVAAVLAITLLPFTLVGPFVSPLLDKWSRRQVAVIASSLQAALALLIGVIIFSGGTSGGWQVVLFLALLAAMSINRFVLAALSAAMQHTVEPNEYLTASSILPTLGPLGMILGFVIGAAARFGFGSWMPAHQADGIVFFISTLLFVLASLAARGFARTALGPDVAIPGKRVREVVAELRDAAVHLRPRGPVWLGLGMMGVTRFLFGLLSVSVILAARNLFNQEPSGALADLTIWGMLTGGGFVCATPLVPVLVRWLGLRRTAVAVLFLGCVAQLVMALAPGKWVIFVSSFFVGLSVQSFKIITDTVVQAHVVESFKGRVFVFYDVLFNGFFVFSAVVAALVLPHTGISSTVWAVMAAVFGGLALAFAIVSRRMGAQRFERGTEDLAGTKTPVTS